MKKNDIKENEKKASGFQIRINKFGQVELNQEIDQLNTYLNDNVEDKLYVLGQGGDESKSPWFAQIGDFPVERFYESDLATSNNYFDEQTMLGKMIPFNTVVYYEPQTQENSSFYKPGFVKIISKNIYNHLWYN